MGVGMVSVIPIMRRRSRGYRPPRFALDRRAREIVSMAGLEGVIDRVVWCAHDFHLLYGSDEQKKMRDKEGKRWTKGCLLTFRECSPRPTRMDCVLCLTSDAHFFARTAIDGLFTRFAPMVRTGNVRTYVICGGGVWSVEMDGVEVSVPPVSDEGNVVGGGRLVSMSLSRCLPFPSLVPGSSLSKFTFAFAFALEYGAAVSSHPSSGRASVMSSMDGQL